MSASKRARDPELSRCMQSSLPSKGEIGEDKLSWELTPGPWYGACLTHNPDDPDRLRDTHLQHHSHTFKGRYSYLP